MERMDEVEKETKLKKIKDSIKSKKVKGLIDDGAIDGDLLLPALPSAQMYYKGFNKKDKEDLVKAIRNKAREQGEDEDEEVYKYEAKIFAHFPQNINPNKYKAPTYIVKEDK